tara:strand:+ start:3576 stop:5612 length:2037 start_codon:yes stop_codon:yes gene_type:complete
LSNNPLLNSFDTPFNTVPFNDIELKHYIPAIKTGIKVGLENISRIENNFENPTFENTILALECCSEDLNTALTVYFNLYSSEADEELQKLAEQISPMYANFENDLFLNEALFTRVKSVYQDINQLSKNDARLTEKFYKSFVKKGALLSANEKEKMRTIDEKLSVLSPRFSKNVLNATNAFELWIEDEKELDGLPESALIYAKEEAKAKGREDVWLFTLQMPSYLPFMKYAKNRNLREKMYLASQTKCTSGKFNNCEIITDITQLKFEKAQLLGYDTYADFILEDRMAEDVTTVNKFMEDLYEPSMIAAKIDMKLIADYAKKIDEISTLKPWDIGYYSEKLQEEKFGFDDETLRPYFSSESVINGAFDIANKLYGLSFEKLDDIQVFHPDVEVYEVTEENRHIGILYIDLYPRETKKSGAWMNELRSQGYSRGKVERPHVTMTCNLTKPSEDTPSLLTLREVETIFHEFGHCLHGLLSDCKYQSIGGTSVKWDFVELPSQIMENWVIEKQALDLFAKHYETDKNIPEEMINKVRSSRQFLSGLMSIRQLQFGYLDMGYHSVNPKIISNPLSYEKEILEKTQLLEPVEGTSISCSFSHIFAGGYSAGYYSYKWAEVLDADAFEKFKDDGIFNAATAKSFREHILSKGNLENPKELYKKFKGSEPSTIALLKREGLLQYIN